MRRGTVTVPETGQRYSGMKCPACPAVCQPVQPVDGGKPSEREGLRQHWLVCHPERPFKELDAR